MGSLNAILEILVIFFEFLAGQFLLNEGVQVLHGVILRGLILGGLRGYNSASRPFVGDSVRICLLHCVCVIRLLLVVEVVIVIPGLFSVGIVLG